MTWKKDKFKNIIKHKSGYTWSKEQETKFPEPKTVRVLTVTNVQKELDLSSELYLKDVKEVDKVKKAVSKHWSIAVSSNGNRKRIGNAVYIKEDSEYLFASFLTAFKPKKDADILPEYFFRWLKSHQIQERITAVSEGTTGLGNLDIRFLRNMDIEYPEQSSEQIAIDSILSKVDETIEATKNSVKASEKLKKALIQNLLTGKLKPDGTWRAENEFFEDEKIGIVPKDWVLSRIKKVIKLKNGKGNTTSNLRSEPDNKYNIPVFGGNGITGYYHTPLLNQSTLLIGRVGEYCGNVFMTPTLSWVTDNAMLVKEFLIDEYSLEFFKYKFNTLNFINYSDTTGQPKLTQSSIGSILFCYPKDLEEQKMIAKKINEVEINIDEKQTKIQKLQRLKKSLMQNLLTGKIRLPANFIAQFENKLEATNSKVEQ
jgi:type I restriction enzyme S subunit